MTVTDQAIFSYNLYQYDNSDAARNNTVDASEVSKKYYNISNLTNALDAVSKVSSTDGFSIGNLNSYAGGMLEYSQLGDYGTLSKTLEGSSVSSLLSNNTSLSGMYSLLGYNAEATKIYCDSLAGGSGSYLDLRV